MKVLVLGGDGFCGWPCALNLADQGHEVVIVDNLSRRKIDVELGVTSLTPIATIEDRLKAWQEMGGRPIGFVLLDLAQEYERLLQLLRDEAPDAVVHFAEQRAAPYSMKSAACKRYTVDNNVNGTHNLLCAIVESGLDVHVVHLGTMGVYGYGSHRGATIPEGYLTVEVPQPDGSRFTEQILHPANPGSVYHMSKTLDQLLFFYYNKNDALRITDLHQGIVWGTNTELCGKDPRLINRFDYDGDYGTVLNRFLMQAAINYPLTVHGTGGQTRAFIHIRDSVRCVQLALDNPPAPGEKVKIFNQMTESHQVGHLAQKVAHMTGAQVAHLPNPRNEARDNDLIVDNRCFLDLGLEPTTLDDGLLTEVVDIARRYAERCDRRRIPCMSAWTRTQAEAINP
ncbi:MAG: NAD-dependent epimerase/dehydratase family protein [Synechococcus sp. SB0673_bin_10]|uniref:NAD-dependent epimerase/dehydratase family protein n=1 Tax=Synechococcus sp. SB0676_bin_10 TaxID=2604869 RepID=A0A6B1F7T1_9SYNE|nr:NAD-dependent epimerase/dehydratase family protein [Cyanobacteria bacterium MAG IRC3_bin_20]MXW12118.1 NAD-dependent epimerase/dehydratase family protein [Synechococcus sp. SB0668_bin_13]MXX08585.1 NAD-dependent epimerase/dehydratase family protein [Synechococcus sp. SB0667_bin_8]MYG37836.1 NAD-dependent epimerase/dehydratase family protein [Synechococcus sp. SB0676_bin_10]MYG64942.1 NAD-dependent epimerase/dehydratase family protein [Synechococcus sp. SB0675_bin_7]MYI71293.1 NAD-dependent 